MGTISAAYQNFANKYFLLINLAIFPRKFLKIGINNHLISFHSVISDMKIRINDMNSKEFFTFVITCSINHNAFDT